MIVMQQLRACFANMLPCDENVLAGRLEAWPGAGAGLR